MSVTFKKPIDDQLVGKIVDFLGRSNKCKTILGLSDSIDSYVACSLLKTALGENFTPVIIDLSPSPHPSMDTEETKYLFRFASSLGLSCIIVKAGSAYLEQMAIDPPQGKLKVKFTQRFLNHILLQTADNLGAIICDPLDKSERVLGLKDSSSRSTMPFYSLYKSEIYDLAQFLNLPGEFIKEEISNFGISYPQLDLLIYLLLEKQMSVADIVSEYTIDPNLVSRLKKALDHQAFAAPSQLII